MGKSSRRTRREFLVAAGAAGAGMLMAGAGKAAAAEPAGERGGAVDQWHGLNVRDFGAAGDGKTDDTKAIQKALDSAAGVQGTVFVPEGVYLCGELKMSPGTGIYGFPNQDVGVQESMGRIVDRTREHLGTSDVAIIRYRRRLIESIRRFIDGEPPVAAIARLYRPAVFVVGFVFRLLALALVAVGMIGISSSMTFLGIAPNVLFGGLCVPFHRHFIVLWNTIAIGIHTTEKNLRSSITL
jgi:hypothetical protein